MAEAWRYKAFISYAHRDAKAASWLHRRLESYRPPQARGEKQAAPPLRPVFRDRDELPASGHLGPLLTGALEQSEFLILICSPAAAQSRWVGEEIRHFRKHRGAGNILAFIVDGEPHSGGADECFPPALLEPEDDGTPVEPVAADARGHADGRRLAFLKLAAGLLNRELDALVQRDAARRNRRLAAVATGSMAGMVGALGLALYAEGQRREAVDQRLLAQKNARTAEATVDYLIDTFAIANPATENPRTITALTILERGAEGIETLGDEPDVQARLYGAVGAIYRNLGLYDDAETSFSLAVGKTEPGSEDAIRAQLLEADVAVLRADYDAAIAILDEQAEAIEQLGRDGLPLKAGAAALRARIFKDQLKLDEAITAYKQSREAYRAADGDFRSELASIADNLGLAYAIKGAEKNAERELLSALELRRALYPEGHKKLATPLNNLAYHYFHVGDLDQAERYVEEASAIKQRVLDPSHPQLAMTQMMHGQILEAQDDLNGAAREFSAALGGLSAAFPDGHYERGFAGVYLASVLGKQGRTDEALALLDDAAEQYDLGYGRLHANHGDLEVYRADILMRAGRVAEAKQACARAVDILGQTIGADAAPSIQLTDRCRSMGAL